MTKFWYFYGKAVVITFVMWGFGLLVGAAAGVSGYYFSALVFGGLIFLLAYLMPLGVKKLFGLTAVGRGTGADLLLLAKKHGVFLKQIYCLTSKRTNAMAFGLFDNKSVVIFSNLLARHPVAEQNIIMLHEVAHHKHNDVFLYATFFALAIAILGLVGLQTINLLSAGAITLPLAVAAYVVFAALSRRREKMADDFACKAGGLRDSFGEALKRFADFEQEAGKPIYREISAVGRFFLTHPAIEDRMR